MKSYKFIFLLLILLSICLRFYRFDSLWSPSADEARDALIAKESIKRGEIPLIGSFSSAGPFVFGPLFYWFIILSYLVLPSVLTAPWLFTAITSVITVVLIILSAKLLLGNKAGLLAGLLTAVSPQLVYRSKALSQHTLVALWTASCLYFFLRLLKEGKQLYAFLFGLSLGVALSMHYQAINLLFIIPFTLLAKNSSLKRKIINSLLILIGLLTASIPLLIWDSNQNFANLRNIIDFLLIGQYRFYVPNSWRLFTFQYLPNYWSFALGGMKELVFVSQLLIAFSAVYIFLRKKLNLMQISLGTVFFVFLLLNRYYKGERFEGYQIYMLPFIILFTSFAVITFYRFKGRAAKAIAITFVCSLLLGSFYKTAPYFHGDTQIKLMRQQAEKLAGTFRQTKFKVYNYTGLNTEKAYSLSLILLFYNSLSSDGFPIGVCYSCPSYTSPIGDYLDYKLVLLPHNLDYKKEQWIYANPEGVYDDLIGWSQKNKLTSSYKFFWEK